MQFEKKGKIRKNKCDNRRKKEENEKEDANIELLLKHVQKRFLNIKASISVKFLYNT